MNQAHTPVQPFLIRSARPEDLDAMHGLENRCFKEDRMSRRSLRWMITKANDCLLIAEIGGRIAGYILVLYHRGTSLGRIYSLAIEPACRGQGLAQALLAAAEDDATERGCALIRLEVRADNATAMSLYERNGYQPFDRYDAYYEDGSPAVRMQKRLHPRPDNLPIDIPYYAQSLDFSCGPASLMMVMGAFNPNTSRLDQSLELQLWREATTVFMTTGHGGCSPHGLALAAARRGYRVELTINSEAPPFIDSVRTPAKRQVIERVHADFLEQMEGSSIKVRHEELRQDYLEGVLERGGLSVVLISTYTFCRCKSPHWVVITGFDEHQVFFHDPYIDAELMQKAIDNQHIPIPRQRFDRVARFGRNGLRTAVSVFPPER